MLDDSFGAGKTFMLMCSTYQEIVRIRRTNVEHACDEGDPIYRIEGLKSYSHSFYGPTTSKKWRMVDAAERGERDLQRL